MGFGLGLESYAECLLLDGVLDLAQKVLLFPKIARTVSTPVTVRVSSKVAVGIESARR